MKNKTAMKITALATVLLVQTAGAAALTWDANNTGAGQTNGAGAWLGANQWWDGANNVNWTDGDDATFGGPATAGGAVTLASPTEVNSLTFNPSFTGTYTLGTAGQAMTLNAGITKNASSAAVTIASPILLGGNQTWLNNSTGVLLVNTPGVTNAGFDLTVDGTGPTTFGVVNNANITLSGSGGFTKNGTGRLVWGGVNAGYSGTTTLNGGVTLVNSIGTIGSGNLTLNGGIYEEYWTSNFTRSLGAGAGQVQILGGASGFSENGATGMTVRLNNSAAFEVVWGLSGEGLATGFFNPSTLVLQSAFAQNGSGLTFDNKIDLNGANRTIASDATSTATATFAQAIRNSTGTAGLVKTGVGQIILSNASNTYNGDTTVNQGILTATVTGALPGYNSPGKVTVASGAILGTRTGASWTMANIETLRANATWSSTGSILGLDTSGGNFVFSNDIAGAQSIAKLGNNSLTLSGNNTYTGNTYLYAGNNALIVDSATALGDGGDVTFRGGTLRFSASGASLDLGSRIKNSSSTVLLDTNGQNISISGNIDGSNTAGITKSGTGTLTLGDANTYTGSTIINQGTVVATGAAVLGGAAGSTADANNIVFGLNLNSGALEFETAANLGAASQIRFRNTGGTAGQGGVLKYVGTTTQTVSKTIQCDTSIGIRLESESVGGAVTFNGPFSQSNRALYLGGSGTGNNQMNTAFTGNGTLTKRDGGTWSLGAANTYTGTTSVEGGTLLINGSTAAAGMVNVSSGATLGGNGTSGNVTIADGFLSPGAGLDNTFAVRSLTLDPSSTLVFGLDDPFSFDGNDLIQITNALTLAGQINIHAQPGGSGYDFLTATVGTQWEVMKYSPGNLLSAGDVTIGTAPALASGLAWSVDTTTADGSVFLTVVVPEAGTAGLAALGLLLLRRLRRH